MNSARVIHTTDPVCGMKVTRERAAGEFAYKDELYLFCNPRCLARFKADPEKYLNSAATVAANPAATVPTPAPSVATGAACRGGSADRAAGTEYTCPMHPEVRQLGPGNCPLCGMALEPAVFDKAKLDEPDPELKAMSRRFWISAALSLPLLVLGMAEMLGGSLGGLLSATTLARIQFVLATPVVLWGLALVVAWVSVARHPSPEHVHPYRLGRYGGLHLQRLCHPGARSYTWVFSC